MINPIKTKSKLEEGRKIIKGTWLIIDRGTLGQWTGKLVYYQSYLAGSGFGSYGVIKTSDGQEHSFDTFVHGVRKAVCLPS